MHRPLTVWRWFLLLGWALGAGCLLDFDSEGKDRCASDRDCLEGRICQVLEPRPPAAEPPGVCVFLVDEAPTDCAPFDQDQDQAFTLTACGPLDCDDADARRSSRLPELCDGVDNDCDGIVDEGLRNGCGGCGALPEERCNGLDDDCDGIVDDGVRNACGFCGALPVEVCDRRDNDCDGQVDEGLDCACDPDAPPRACPGEEAGAQICVAGQQRCLEGRWGPCDGAALGERVERCDGLDNNCNGEVDEAFNLNNNRTHCGACEAPCQGPWAEGECTLGRCALRCLPGRVNQDGLAGSGCEYACTPGAEIERCDDGVDNNCDGRVDESCARAVLGGRWAFFNLYGRNADGRPPALVTGTMEVTDPVAGLARITDLVRYADDLEGGRLVYDRPSERRVLLTAAGDLTLSPNQEGDPGGGTFRGVLTAGPGRSLAALIEYSDDGRQIASLALLLRLPPEGSPAGFEQLRGPYLALQVAPGALIAQGELAPDAVALASWALDADAPLGRGVERWRQRGDGALTAAPGARPVTLSARAGAPGLITLDRAQRDPLGAPQALERFAGALDDAGGLALLTRAEATQPDPIPAPGLTVLLERRAAPDPARLQGRWSLQGLQARWDDPAQQIRYNALQHELDLRAPGDGDADLSVTLIGEGEAGALRLLALDDGDGAGALIEVELDSPDNIDPPALRLRGHATARGDLILLWEVDDERQEQPTPSLFFMTRRPDGAP
jgi:hypothetical protein